MNDITFGSVFSGVGMLDFGLCLADIDHAWFCEQDDWRREEILARRWPDADRFSDIRELRADELAPVDGIVGGFPCKGASTAGKRNGFEHPETVLWREQFRLIRDVRPRYVLVENVANILSLYRGAVWGEVLGDLASLGFRVWWDCVPAAAVGAPHRRDRVFAVAADPERTGLEGLCPSESRSPTLGRGRPPYGDGETPPDSERLGGRPEIERDEDGGPEPGGSAGGTRGRDHAIADPERECGERRGEPGDLAAEGREAEGKARQRQRGGDAAVDRGPAATDPDGAGNRGNPVGREHEAVGRTQQPGAADPAPGGGVERIRVDWGKYTGAVQRWERVFGAAPEPLIRRMDDGGARRVDRSRLSALGDGVQVQVGQFVGDFIQRVDRGEVTG